MEINLTNPAGSIVTVSTVIVCYKPVETQLLRLCNAILGDGGNVILVDNTEVPYLEAQALPEGCQLITLGYNSGIAHAQNVGIAAARRGGAAIIVFFDQDSTIESGFVAKLVAPLTPGKAEIVSPLYVDDTDNSELPSVRVGPNGSTRTIHRGGSDRPYPVDIVISSGTAATWEVFDVAGGFNEGLFIDFVDTEWCLRCRSKNIPIHVIPGAVMRHRIGSRSVKLGPFTVLVHNPTRCYYQIRNGFLLLRIRHIPKLFAARQILSIMFSRGLLLFFIEDRVAYLKAYFSALRDGFKGTDGARPTQQRQG